MGTNIGSFQKLGKKTSERDHPLNATMYMSIPPRRTESLRLEVGMVAAPSGAGRWDGREGPQGTFWSHGDVPRLDKEVYLLSVCIFFRMNFTAQLISMHSVVCKLCQ